MTKQRNRFAVVGALVLGGLSLLAACGGGGANGAEVASLAGSGQDGTTTTTAASQTSMEDAALNFARCMRDHGVDMPDPTVGPNGDVNITLGGGPQDQAKMQAAQQACQSIMDAARADAPKMDPAQIEEEKQKLLAFAQCMREHGIDMPDPQIDTDGGGLQVRVGAPGGGGDVNSPAFQAANEACSAQAGIPLPDAKTAGQGAAVSTGGANP